MSSLRGRLSPEARLHLLAGADGAGEAFAAAASERVDWDRVIALARRDRALGALAARVREVKAGGPPAEVRERIARLGRIAAFRQAELARLLASALDVLAAEGVPVLLLKGAALAVAVYPGFADREMSDADLLVPAGRAGDAQRALLRAGWRPLAGCRAAAQEALYAGHHHLAPLADPSASGVVVEVHVEPLPPGHPFAFSAAELWRDARPAALGGRPVRVPSPDHHLLHLSLHFAWAHALRGAGWRTVRDVRVLAQRAPPEWDGVPRRAREARADTCVYWTLRLARGLADAPVPAGVVDALRPRGPAWVLHRLERHLAATLAGEAECPSPWLCRCLWEAAVRPRHAGHGNARPWHRDRAFAAAGVPSGDPSSPTPSWRDLPGWRRWIAAVAR